MNYLVKLAELTYLRALLTALKNHKGSHPLKAEVEFLERSSKDYNYYSQLHIIQLPYGHTREEQINKAVQDIMLIRQDVMDDHTALFTTELDPNDTRYGDYPRIYDRYHAWVAFSDDRSLADKYPEYLPNGYARTNHSDLRDEPLQPPIELRVPSECINQPSIA